MQGAGCRVQQFRGSGVQGAEVQGSRLRVQGPGSRVQSAEVQGCSGVRSQDQGLEFRVDVFFNCQVFGWCENCGI